jgi:hypothetical protein
MEEQFGLGNSTNEISTGNSEQFGINMGQAFETLDRLCSADWETSHD